MVASRCFLGCLFGVLQLAVDGPRTMRDYYCVVKHNDLCLSIDLLLYRLIILSWFILAIIVQGNGRSYSALRKIKGFKTAARKGKGANINRVPTVFQAVLQKYFHVLSSQYICEVFILISTLQMKNWNSDYICNCFMSYSLQVVEPQWNAN